MQVDARLRELRGQLKDLQNQFDKSENDLKVTWMLICVSDVLSNIIPVVIELDNLCSRDRYFKKYSQACGIVPLFSGCDECCKKWDPYKKAVTINIGYFTS